jgi:hypothetical protein
MGGEAWAKGGTTWSSSRVTSTSTGRWRGFDLVADERNEPRYNPRMWRAEKITEGPIGVGTATERRLRAWVEPSPW